VTYFGRIVRSAISRNCRAIWTGSPASTSFAASSQTSRCAERISASMMSTARSFCLRLTRPATRYQTRVARSWASQTVPDIQARRRMRTKGDAALMATKKALLLAVVLLFPTLTLADENAITDFAQVAGTRPRRRREACLRGR
jgi:hypothetical protein